MNRCFVGQPFDKGKFDKRYDDIIEPAIEKASLEPYRIDRDPSVGIPIDEIENEIHSSTICLFEITTDNPNVWFELGYAIAIRKEVVLICSNERTTKFPFDVQHRSIIPYAVDSPSDFQKLSNDVTQTLVARMQKKQSMGNLTHVDLDTLVNGLERHQIAALVSIGQHLQGGVTANVIYTDMERSGFNRLATTLGVKSLIEKGFANEREEHGWNETYIVYEITKEGHTWLQRNLSRLTLSTESSSASEVHYPF